MSVSIVILAGGKSLRMGQDKGLVRFSGKMMIEHVLEAARKLDLPLSIVANNKAYEQFGVTVRTDDIPDKGPLGGIYTALNHASTSHVLILPCDTPMINTLAIERMIEKGSDAKAAVAMQDNAIHPLFAIYSKDLLSKIKSQLDADALKVTDATGPFMKVSFDDMDKMLFANLNTMEDLITWQQ